MNWYERRLGVQPSQQHPAPRLPAPPPAAPHYQRPTPSSLQSDHCPSCASANYMAPPGTERKRCFDCGYPIVQSGSGLPSMGQTTDGTVHRATQVQGDGYHPQQIIGRVE